MLRILRFILAVVAGFFAGSAVNMGLIALGGALVPPPAGTDTSTMEALVAAMPLFEPRHFIFPFLAHALGTGFGAFLAVLIAPARSPIPGIVVGALFLAGGIAATLVLPAPIWFSVLDLVLAYVPTAWLGVRLARGGRVRTRG